MEPIPEVRAAASRLSALADETMDLMAGLEAVSVLAVALLPSCVGVSITVVVDGDPFTVTATSAEATVLDAMQYVDGGPCVVSAVTDRLEPVGDVLDEERWQLYAVAAAAVGVRSSLSMPLRGPDGASFGALNLYAGEPEAFSGKQERIAELFGVHVNDMVRNADLSFMTRDFARELPQRLEDHQRVNEAIGVLSERRGWSPQEARARMEVAAGRAGAPISSIAEVVMVMGLD